MHVTFAWVLYVSGRDNIQGTADAYLNAVGTRRIAVTLDLAVLTKDTCQHTSVLVGRHGGIA